jgi:hypothetical protein
VLLTTDSNLKYQQNLESRRIAVVVLSSEQPDMNGLRSAMADAFMKAKGKGPKG